MKRKGYCSAESRASWMDRPLSLRHAAPRCRSRCNVSQTHRVVRVIVDVVVIVVLLSVPLLLLRLLLLLLCCCRSHFVLFLEDVSLSLTRSLPRAHNRDARLEHTNVMPGIRRCKGGGRMLPAGSRVMPVFWWSTSSLLCPIAGSVVTKQSTSRRDFDTVSRRKISPAFEYLHVDLFGCSPIAWPATDWIRNAQQAAVFEEHFHGKRLQQ